MMFHKNFQTFIQRLPDPDDLSPLTSPIFIADALSSLSAKRKKAGTGWRGVGNSRQVVKLES
jgi:hypothetical protein